MAEPRDVYTLSKIYDRSQQFKESGKSFLNQKQFLCDIACPKFSSITIAQTGQKGSACGGHIEYYVRW